MPARDATESTGIKAPPGALAWTPESGWILDDVDLLEARANNECVYAVGDDRLIRDVDGVAPLAALMRVDRDLHLLTRQIGDLVERLANALDP